MDDSADLGPVTQELSEEQLLEQRLAVQTFLESNFYKKYLQPYLEGKEHDAKINPLYSLGASDFDPHKIAIRTAYWGGYHESIYDLCRTLARWANFKTQLEIKEAAAKYKKESGGDPEHEPKKSP